jgi:hypothetical protein
LSTTTETRGVAFGRSPGLARQLSDRERRSAGRFDAQIIAELYTAIYARMLYSSFSHRE